MVDHNVVRFNVSVHDTLAMAKVQPLEQLVDVVPYVNVVKLGVQAPKICIVDMLEDQRRCLALYQETLALSPWLSMCLRN